MLVRERLTGMAPPTAAKKMVDLWRPVLEDKIGTRLDQLARFTEDQARFGDLVHDLLSALDLGDDRNMDSDDEDNDENQDGENDQSRMTTKTTRTRTARTTSPVRKARPIPMPRRR